MSTRTRIKKLAETQLLPYSLLTFFIALFAASNSAIAQEGLVIEIGDVVEVEGETVELVEVDGEIDYRNLNRFLNTHEWEPETVLAVTVIYGTQGITEKDLCGEREDWGVLPPICATEYYWLKNGRICKALEDEEVIFEPEEVTPDDVFHLLQKLNPTQPKAVKAMAAMKRLGAPDCRTRKAAQAELVKIGLPALYAVMQGMKSPDPEVRRRSAEVLPVRFFERLELGLLIDISVEPEEEDLLRRDWLTLLIELYPLMEHPSFSYFGYYEGLRKIVLCGGSGAIFELVRRADMRLQKTLLSDIVQLTESKKTRSKALDLISTALPVVDLETRLDLLWVYAPPKPRFVPVKPRKTGPFFPDKEMEKRVRAGRGPEPEEW